MRILQVELDHVQQTWMERAMAFKTSPRSSGGVTNWTAAKSMVLESPVYPGGSALSNLMLKTVPERDCVSSREKGTYSSQKRAH